MIWVVVKSVLGVFLILKFIVYLTNASCKSKVCMVGKTALITGGNSGIGLELAKELALRGCTIIIADKDDATNTVMELIKITQNRNISSKLVDFTSLKSVRLFADELKRNIDKLHILVNNAGIGDISYENTEDGIQKVMQVNYFSHFLLTHLLLELLLKSAPSRLVYTSSMAAYVADLLEQDLKGQPPSDMKIWTSGSYGNSKLAGAIMSKMLATQLDNTGVTCNTYHPGLVKTNIWNALTAEKHINVYFWVLWTYIFGKSPEEGVQTLLYLACASEIEGISGKFFMECTPVWQPRKVKDKVLSKKIWDLSEKYVNLKPEEKLDVILQKWQTKN